MYRKNLIKIFVFVFFVSAAYLFLAGSGSNEVSAQNFVPNQGVACQENFAECDPGQVNLIQAVRNGEVSLANFTEGAFEYAYAKDWVDQAGYGYYNTCVTEELYEGDYVLVYLNDSPSQGRGLFHFLAGSLVTAATNVGGGGENVSGITLDLGDENDFSVNSLLFGDGDTRLAINKCPLGYEASAGPNRAGAPLVGTLEIGLPLGFSIEPLASDALYGCCPTGFTYVNRKDQDTKFEAQAGGCCRGNPGDFSHWDGGCRTDGDVLVYNDNSYDSGGDALEIGPNSSVQDSVEALNIIRDNPRINAIHGGDLDENPYPFYVGSVLGEDALGQYAQYTTSAVRNSDSDYTCPSGFEDGCVIMGDDESYSPGDLANGGLSDQIVQNLLADDDFDPGDTDITGATAVRVGEIGNTCKRCFRAGEAMRVQGDQLEICQGGGETTQIDLVNGNVQDTLAFLRADDANRPLLQSCREQGGIYIAIGCIDPSPVGIVTNLIRITLGVIGGVALIQLLIAGIAYQSGNEEQIQEAQKRLFATLGGLAFLVFSILILRIIGVNILNIVPEGAF